MSLLCVSSNFIRFRIKRCRKCCSSLFTLRILFGVRKSRLIRAYGIVVSIIFVK